MFPTKDNVVMPGLVGLVNVFNIVDNLGYQHLPLLMGIFRLSVVGAQPRLDGRER